MGNIEKLLAITMIAFVLLLALVIVTEAHDVVEDNNVMYAAIDLGTDGNYYMRCVVGCEYFYLLASINDLYQPFPSTWQAYNYFLQVRAAYEGVSYVPLPPPMSG